MEPLVTVILMSYKREPNMPAILKSYREQSVPVEIWLINNDGFKAFGADRLIAIPWNAGEMARYLFTRRVETEWVCFQDDDWLIGDPYFIQEAIEICQHRCYRYCVGTAGRLVTEKAPHYALECQPDSYTNFLKGHFQLFRKEVAKDVRLPWHPYRSDIQFSLDISKGQRRHWVSAELKGRLKRMETHGVGLEFRPEHWQEAEEVCAAYIKEYGLCAS